MSAKGFKDEEACVAGAWEHRREARSDYEPVGEHCKLPQWGSIASSPSGV